MKKIFVVFSVLVLLLCSCATFNKNTSQVSVSGTGTVTLKADMVSFTINVSETAETTGKAQQLANEKLSQILTILRSYKILEKDISTTALNFSSEYEWNSDIQKSVKVGENVSQTLSVKMKDLDSFGLLLDELGSRVTGISFYNVSFDCEDREEAKKQARELAYQDALEKAQIYAEQSGLKLGKPITINDENHYVTARVQNYDAKLMYANGIAEEAAYSTEVPTGTLCVNVNTSVLFELK